MQRSLQRERVAIVATLFRVGRDLDLAEEALQEASARALARWPSDGIPDRPGAWLTVVARNWMVDQLRMRNRLLEQPDDLEDEGDVDGGVARASQLELLFACCSVDFAGPTRVTLALKTLMGFGNREIARGYLETESATAARVSRARRRIRDARPQLYAGPERSLAIDAVLETLYLVFNEGYLATDGDGLLRQRLVHQSLSLARTCAELLPFHAEAHALAALFHLHAAREAARVSPSGALVPLEEQDRGKWDGDRISTGQALLEHSMQLLSDGDARGGPYQVQAAIAWLHVSAPTPEDTDWVQIAALYGCLFQLTPTPVVELNAAVALAMSGDLKAGLTWVNSLEKRGALARYHLLPAVKADLLRRGGHRVQARRYYEKARRLATNEQERRFLTRRLEELA